MNSKNILIAGGSGLIGTALIEFLENKGYHCRILSRKPTNIEQSVYHWDPEAGEIDLASLKDIYAIINFSGASILGGQWTKKRKELLRSSRIESTQFLISSLKSNQVEVQHFIQASAMGYYGNRSDEILTENSAAGTGFLSELCQDWESEAEKAKEFTQVSITRIGLYFHPNASIVSVVQKLSRFYLAAGFGTGSQYANYTHKDEYNKLIEGILNNSLSPATYNAVGFRAETLDVLLNGIAKSVNRKIILPNIPAFILKLVLGEASSALLDSIRVESEVLKRQNFHLYHSIDEAIQHLD